MAISDIKVYAHLTAEDVEALGVEFDQLRADIEASRGAEDAAYIKRVIRGERAMVASARVVLMASKWKPAWALGTALLGTAKILENMEIGHNVMHGQWDWMNDPEIHSSTWEWDTAGTAEQWKHSHNFVHHTFTNVIGKDDDVGYGILRVSRDQKWHPVYLGQPIYNVLLALLFEWGVGIHDLDLDGIRNRTADKQELRSKLSSMGKKMRRQIVKDYVVYPALSGPAWRSTLSADVTANVIRNLWSYAVIFCGHFPDGAEKFTLSEWENETRSEWYLRQLLGSANLDGGKLFHLLTGNLSFQIEHHLFPDLPSNRYQEMSARVRDICTRYGLPYTSGPMWKQYGQVWRTIAALSVPNKFGADRLAPRLPMATGSLVPTGPGTVRESLPVPA